MIAMDTPTVVFADNHLLVVVKPAGMLAQGDRTGDASLVDWAERWLAESAAKPGKAYVGLVHRLDRPVGGLMVLARTSKAAARLSAAFRDRTVDKRYLALVERPLPEAAGRSEGWLVPGRGTVSSRWQAAPCDGGQTAVLGWRTLDAAGAGTLVEVGLETGRKHQIRAQLAALGSPILGDRRYGARKPWAPAGSIALFAWSLTVPHPIGGAPTTFEAWPERPWPARPERLSD
jgi:23S rRNA pseudouridine1911/1915/1917 synthase